MRNLRKKINNGRATKKTNEQIQSNAQKKKIPQPSMGLFIVKQKSQGLYQMHQNNNKENIACLSKKIATGRGFFIMAPNSFYQILLEKIKGES